MNYAKIFTIFVLASISSLSANAQSAALADMQQDLSLLRREVGALKTEIEQLRRENQLMAQKVARVERSGVASEAVTAQVAGVRSQTSAQMDKLKREIIEQVKKDIESMANQTNAQMSKLANAISKVPQSEPQKSFSEDYPKTGITYTVKSGDSLSKIARDNNSRIKWIQDANKIADPSRGLRIGEQIFIPQK